MHRALVVVVFVVVVVVRNHLVVARENERVDALLLETRNGALDVVQGFIVDRLERVFAVGFLLLVVRG